jgi:hypothetical protein
MTLLYSLNNFAISFLKEAVPDKEEFINILNKYNQVTDHDIFIGDLVNERAASSLR